jgi:hypothetical protein
MPPSISSAVRDVLRKDIDLPADAVIKKVKARGITASDGSIRHVVHNLRGPMRKRAGLPAPAAARLTLKPASGGPELAAVLANVALVNTVVGACGGVETARQAAEAVRACGGVDAFLKHLDLIAGIRGGEASG